MAGARRAREDRLCELLGGDVARLQTGVRGEEPGYRLGVRVRVRVRGTQEELVGARDEVSEGEGEGV